MNKYFYTIASYALSAGWLFLSFTLHGCFQKTQRTPQTGYIRYDDTRSVSYGNDFELVTIRSSLDQSIQKAFFYKTRSKHSQPLVISLHTWSGNYAQKDTLAAICRSKDINYIHPDFRGPDTSANACCSNLVIADIDDAIAYAIQHALVDTANIFLTGVSGGGYATLAMYMKSKQRIRKFSAWAPITDLNAWYYESRERKSNYADQILKCTSSLQGKLDEENARQRSPIYWPLPPDQRLSSRLEIFEGVNDGITGSVPITHSIYFYNKLLAASGVTDSSFYVTKEEELKLLKDRRPLGHFGEIESRPICLEKKYKNFRLVIFTGTHEMLPVYTLNELLNDNPE